LNSYTDHLEGKVDPVTRTHGRKDKDLPDTEAIEEDDEAVEDKAPKARKDSQSEYNTSRGFDRLWEKKKFKLHENCKLEFMKQGRVENLSDDYLLV
jgi:hypothetical protein